MSGNKKRPLPGSWLTPGDWRRAWLLLVWLSASMAAANEATINVVAFIERPLIYEERGKPVGVLVKVVDELFRRAKLDYLLRLVPPKRAIQMTEDSQNFCVFPIERSQEREARFQWISPILISRHGLYSHPDSSVALRTLADARPYKLGSYLGSGVGEYLEDFGFTVEYASRNELNARKLLMGRIDLWVSDTVSAEYLIERERLRVLRPELVFFTTVRAMACNPALNPAKVKTLQATITQMYREGEIDRIYRFRQAPGIH